MASAWNIFLGIVASTISWLLIARALTPRLEVSALNRVPDSHEPCGYRYRVKVLNKSRFWDVADMSIRARLIIRGLNPDLPNNSTSLRIHVEEPFPVLASRRAAVRPEDRARVYTLRVHDLSGGGLKRLPAEAADALTQRTKSAEELMALGDGSGFIRLAISGSHARSGLRRTYSMTADATAIQEGGFERPDTIAIVPRGAEMTDSAAQPESAAHRPMADAAVEEA